MRILNHLYLRDCITTLMFIQLLQFLDWCKLILCCNIAKLAIGSEMPFTVHDTQCFIGKATEHFVDIRGFLAFMNLAFAASRNSLALASDPFNNTINKTVYNSRSFTRNHSEQFIEMKTLFTLDFLRLVASPHPVNFSVS